MKLSTIVKSLKLENDDDKYVHIGYGKYKQKGHEDDENAPTFTKTDDGKYVKADGGGDGDDKASKPGMDIDAGGAVGGDEPSDEPTHAEIIQYIEDEGYGGDAIGPDGNPTPEAYEDAKEELMAMKKKNETITINGVKYRPLKESKKSKKHQLKEQYDRIFTNRTVI